MQMMLTKIRMLMTRSFKVYQRLKTKFLTSMNLRHATLLKLFMTQLCTIFACETSQFVTLDNQALKGHVMFTMTARYLEVCWSKCAAMTTCLSVNTRKDVNLGIVICEMNNSSKRADPLKLQNHPDYEYHEMTETKMSTDYDCIRKEGLEDDWYRYGDTAVKLINQNKTWSDARAYCQSLGAHLVSIFSARQNDFIYQVLLKDIYLTKKQKESLLADRFVDHWPLDGSDYDVRLRDKPGDAWHEIIDGEMSLYLTGYKSFAEVPAVRFNPEGFTVMLWMKLPYYTSTGAVTFYSAWFAPTWAFIMRVHYKFKKLFTWFVSHTGTQTTYYLSFPFDKWVHFTYTFNKTLSQIKIYYNGTLKQTTSVSNPNLLRPLNPYFHVGIKGDGWPGSSTTMRGHIKHLMVFDKSLNKHEIENAIAFSAYWPPGPWIGLRGNNSTKTYQWSDGTSPIFLEMVPYRPGTGCVAMADSAHWFDTDCQFIRRPFICEKPVA